MTNNGSTARDTFDCSACGTRNVLSPIDHEQTRHDGARVVVLRGSSQDEVAEHNALRDLGA